MRIIIALFLVQFLALPVSGQEIEFVASDIARVLAQAVREQGRKGVAVPTFRNLEGETTPVGALFAEGLVAELGAAKGEDFVIAGRNRTESLFLRQRIDVDDLRMYEGLDAFAKKLEVDTLIVGTISKVQGVEARRRINVRLVALPGGKTIFYASAFIYADRFHGDSGGPQVRSRSKGTVRQSVDDFLFEISRCESRGGNLICTFFVTNKSGDRKLQILNGSRIVTNTGKEYLARRKEIGSRKTTATASIEIVSGIRTEGALHFEGVPPVSGEIPLLEIKCWAPNGFFSVQFRDVLP